MLQIESIEEAQKKFEKGLSILNRLRSNEEMKSNARRSLKGELLEIYNQLSALSYLNKEIYKIEFEQLLPSNWNLSDTDLKSKKY